MATSKKPRSTPRGAKPEDNGQRPESEFDRFPDLTKRLLRVPKEEIKREEQREKGKQGGSSGSSAHP